MTMIKEFVKILFSFMTVQVSDKQLFLFIDFPFCKWRLTPSLVFIWKFLIWTYWVSSFLVLVMTEINSWGCFFQQLSLLFWGLCFELITGTIDLSVMFMEDMLSLTWERTIISIWIQISNFYFYHRLASFEDISFCKKFQKIIQ